MKKININVGAIIDVKAVEDVKSNDYLKDEDIFWRLGTGVVGGRTLPIQRKKCLDGFEYKFNNQVLNAKDIESWSATEFFDWRDS